MNLKQLLFTKNACYIAGRTITPKGIMWHSTGANNPNLKRYVGPDDGLLGNNKYSNHWNQNKPDGREVCVHAFIGKLEDGTIATYQTLPWNHRGWHCGGKGNDAYIGFEICEDDLNSKDYFDKVYQEAVELTAHLCSIKNLDPKGKDVIICHQDGHKLGIASNHSDVYHWFSKYGKTMDDVRNDVAAFMNKDKPQPTPTPTPPTQSSEIKVGDVVSVNPGAKYYNGSDVPSWVESKKWIVSQVKGDRAVIDKSSDGEKSICSPINVKNLKISSSASGGNDGFKPFTVNVTITNLNIRKGPGVNYDRTGRCTGKGVFTITDVKSGKGSDAGWGELKSGAGWISLDFAKRM